LTVTTPPPPVGNIVVSGNGLAPTVNWSVQSGSPATNETVYIFNALSPGAPEQGAAYASPVLPANTTSFTIPSGVLSAGQLYTISVQADVNAIGVGTEARSRTFSAALVAQPGTMAPVVIPTVLPTPSAFSGPIYSFNSPVAAGVPITIDPLAAIGYIFQTGATDPNFASVELPNIGNPNPYSLYLWNGSTFVFDTSLDANTVFDFASGGVNEFEILGIDPNVGLDPNSATDFATTLTFVADGQFTGTMTPIENTPLPAALPLFATGLGGLGLLGYRRKRKSRVSLLGAA
jgi:hypothetical protein